MLHLFLPLAVASAVGEECDAPSGQAFHLFRRQTAAAGCGKPQVLGQIGSHEDGRLLALYDAHMCFWVLGKQMFAEEALVQLPVLWKQLLFNQRYVGPALETVPVPVAAVLHDVPAVYQPLTVYLPEDDVSAPCGSDVVVLIYPPKCLLTYADSRCCNNSEPIPEGAVRRMAAPYVLPGEWPEGRKLYGPDVALNPDACFPGPLVVAEILRRLVVVAAGVLVVALAHLVGHIGEVLLRIHVAHEALHPATLGALEFLLSVSRQLAGF